MSLADSTIKNVTSQGEKILRKIGQRPFVPFDRISGQLATDVVQLSSRGPKSKLSSADVPKIVKLTGAGVPQDKIAQSLGISRVTLQRFIKDKMPNLPNGRNGIMQAFKTYMSSDSQAKKNEAFGIIDKYLEQMAKEEVIKNPEITFDDCLQDLRLKFLEIAKKQPKERARDPKHVLVALRNSSPVKQEVQTVSLDSFEQPISELATKDFAFEKFETEEWLKHLIEHPIDENFKNIYFCAREEDMLFRRLRDGMSLQDIADRFNLTKERVRQVLSKALKNLRDSTKVAMSDEYFQYKTAIAQKKMEHINLNG